MIKLKVDEYCHKCPSFTSDVESPLVAESFDGSYKIAFGDTIVKCKNADICENIFEYLKSREKEG